MEFHEASSRANEGAWTPSSPRSLLPRSRIFDQFSIPLPSHPLESLARTTFPFHKTFSRYTRARSHTLVAWFHGKSVLERTNRPNRALTRPNLKAIPRLPEIINRYASRIIPSEDSACSDIDSSVMRAFGWDSSNDNPTTATVAPCVLAPSPDEHDDPQASPGSLSLHLDLSFSPPPLLHLPILPPFSVRRVRNVLALCLDAN